MSKHNKREFTVDLFSEDDDFEDDNFDDDGITEPNESEREYKKFVEELTQRNTVQNSGEKRKKQKKNSDSPVISNAQDCPALDSQQRLNLGRDVVPTVDMPNPMVVCFKCKIVFKSSRRPVWKEFKLERPEEQCDRCANLSIDRAMKEWETNEKSRLGDSFRFKPFTILVQGEQAEKALKRPLKKPISISSIASSCSSNMGAASASLPKIDDNAGLQYFAMTSSFCLNFYHHRIQSPKDSIYTNGYL
jgi:hypothetical protein